MKKSLKMTKITMAVVIRKIRMGKMIKRIQKVEVKKRV